MEYVANKDIIAKRIAQIFKSGEVVNLGIGLPTLVGKYLPADVNIILQSENGIMGLGPAPAKGCEDRDMVDAGGSPATIRSGGCFFDSAVSFGIIRGGHVDYTVLGALEVDQEGNLANYKGGDCSHPAFSAVRRFTPETPLYAAADRSSRSEQNRDRSRCF